MVSRNQRRRNRPRKMRRRQAPNRVVVMGNNPTRSRRRNAPARRRRAVNRSTGEMRPYHLYGLKCNDKGYLTFGPSGQTPSLGGGILKAFSEYKITQLRVQWKAQASSTAAGSMAIQIGLGTSLTALDNRAISFKLTSSGQRVFTARDLGGDGRMYNSSNEDQFRLAYQGNGDSTLGGDLLCFFRLETRLPK